MELVWMNPYEGLSPRVRGNQHKDQLTVDGLGSIPARAGEPLYLHPHSTDEWVYPRACGGTIAQDPPPPNRLGLSPRVRGNHQGDRLPSSLLRSIPARAGEPFRHMTVFRCVEVYPRACGGTFGVEDAAYCEHGLSPRVRGNLGIYHWMSTKHRSIPARAGEPLAGLRGGVGVRVYPRACGGTGPAWPQAFATRGLSPRVRGNRSPTNACVPWERSIPARAGEPHRHHPAE